MENRFRMAYCIAIVALGILILSYISIQVIPSYCDSRYEEVPKLYLASANYSVGISTVYNEFFEVTYPKHWMVKGLLSTANDSDLETLIVNTTEELHLQDRSKLVRICGCSPIRCLAFESTPDDFKAGKWISTLNC